MTRQRGGNIIYQVIRRPKLFLAAALLAAVVAGACTLTGGGRTPPDEVVKATPIPTFVATPRLPPTDLPAPTPTPVTNLGRDEVEFLVWGRIASCAGQIAASTQTDVHASLTSTYDEDSGTWLVEASIEGLRLSLGVWEVADTAGLVTPFDQVSKTIAGPEIVCDAPEAFLAQGLTPPSLSTLTPTPFSATEPAPSSAPTAPATATPTPAPVHLAANDLQARLAVWVALRSCFDPLPSLDAFTAHRDLPQRWVVEGRGQVSTSSGGASLFPLVWGPNP